MVTKILIKRPSWDRVVHCWAGLVSVLSFKNHLKTQAEDVPKDFSPWFVTKLFDPIERCDWPLLESEQEEEVVTQMVLK